MSVKGAYKFHFIDWNEINDQTNGELSSEVKYTRLSDWALAARRCNPDIFDELTEWILDDNEWSDDKLENNEQILMQDVFARFESQNATLRTYLKELEPSSVVNPAVWEALDQFDSDLTAPMGCPHHEAMREAVLKMYTDFSVMKNRNVREVIAGCKSGHFGTDSVDIYGYINHLKNCDAQVQWCLFMPAYVEKQQNGFKVESFEYKKIPEMRFIGLELIHDDSVDNENRTKVFDVLNDMNEYKSGFDYDVLFMHHYGKGVDVEHWHGFWGRFMKADTPVPEGFLHWDFTLDDKNMPYLTFRSQFAFAEFSGDIDAMHKREGYDSDAMYDVTRNIILGQGITIPYPEIYWTAEVFLNGYKNPGTAYMFSVAFD